MLGGNDLTHELDGRVILAAIVGTASADVDITDTLGAVEPLGSICVDIRIQLRTQGHAQQCQQQGEQDGINPLPHQPHSLPSHGWHS